VWKLSWRPRASLCRYEEYLDSQITAKDIYYLEDVEAVRHLVELGYAPFNHLQASTQHIKRTCREQCVNNRKVRFLNSK
jgi:hypothetical protein